jgi:hypothetical protein
MEAGAAAQRAMMALWCALTTLAKKERPMVRKIEARRETTGAQDHGTEKMKTRVGRRPCSTVKNKSKNHKERQPGQNWLGEPDLRTVLRISQAGICWRGHRARKDGAEDSASDLLSAKTTRAANKETEQQRH